MKKVILLFLLTTFVGIVSAQSEPQKSSPFLKLRLLTEVGVTFPKYDDWTYEVLATGGLQISKYAFLGAGAGINYRDVKSAYVDNDVYIPVYGHLRVWPVRLGHFRPFVEARIGHGFDTDGSDGSFYNSVHAGVEFKKWSFSVGLHELEEKFIEGGDINRRTLNVRVGYLF